MKKEIQRQSSNTTGLKFSNVIIKVRPSRKHGFHSASTSTHQARKTQQRKCAWSRHVPVGKCLIKERLRCSSTARACAIDFHGDVALELNSQHIGCEHVGGLNREATKHDALVEICASQVCCDSVIVDKLGVSTVTQHERFVNF